MEYLHYSSVPATKSELELFTIPPTQTAIESAYEVKYNPTSTLDSSRTYDFQIPASDDFTDLASTYVYIRASITAGAENVDAVRNFGSAMFDQVDIYLNSISITPANNLFHYQSFLEDLLFRQPNPIDCASVISDNEADRKARVMSGKQFDLFFRLHNSMCEQNNLLISNVPISIRLTRGKDTLALVGKGDPSIKVHEISLLIKRVKVFPDVTAGIMLAIDKTPAKYFITRNEVKSFSIGTGLTHASIENVFSGQLPKRMVIGLVSAEAVSGNIETDPYSFGHFGLNYLASYVDGAQVPSVAYSPDFDNNLYMREFVSLYRYINQDEGIPQMDLTYSKYKSCVLFAFDYSADGTLGSETGTLSLVKRGNIRLDLKFKEALKKALYVIVFAQFDNLIQIDKYRNVSLDY